MTPKSRPVTTLFLLMSVDGKISTGLSDERDFDKDLSSIDGARQGLHQYDELEQKTDLCSLNTGKVMAKVGWNEPKTGIEKLPVSFVIIDNQPHLSELGIRNLIQRTKKLFIITTNNDHPAFRVDDESLKIMTYQDQVDFHDLFVKLGAKGIDRITVQSGGELNAILIRNGLIDFVSVVVAPLLIGGKDTPTLMDGASLKTTADLSKLRALKLIAVDTLRDSFLHLRYAVHNE